MMEALMGLENRIPELDACKPGLRALGFTLIVAVAPPKRQTSSGLHLPDALVEREHLTDVKGRVVSLSPAAFDFASFPPDTLPKPGDVIQFARLSGIVTKGADGNEYRLLQDKDVLAIVEEE